MKKESRKHQNGIGVKRGMNGISNITKESKINYTKRRRINVLSVARNLRSEEHTSELQSHSDLVCRLLLEKKKKKNKQKKKKKTNRQH